MVLEAQMYKSQHYCKLIHKGHRHERHGGWFDAKRTSGYMVALCADFDCNRTPCGLVGGMQMPVAGDRACVCSFYRRILLYRIQYILTIITLCVDLMRWLSYPNIMYARKSWAHSDGFRTKVTILQQQPVPERAECCCCWNIISIANVCLHNEERQYMQNNFPLRHEHKLLHSRQRSTARRANVPAYVFVCKCYSTQ